AGDRVAGSEQRARPVLAGETEVERIAAGSERCALLLGLLRLGAQLRQLLVEVGQQGRRRLVLAVETALAGIEARDLRLERREVALRAGRPLKRLFAGLGEPFDLLVRSRGPGLDGVDLAGEARGS